MKKLLPLLLVALVGASCGADTGSVVTTSPTTTATTIGPGGGEDQLAMLGAARRQWVQFAPADYTVTERASCDGCETVTATLAVREGEVVSLAPADSLSAIDEVFAEIEQSILQGADVEVAYHPGLGYPTRVIIDRDGDGSVEVDLELADLEAMPIVRTLEELQRARGRWDSLGLDTYRFIFRTECSCPEGGTLDVEVRDGMVHARVPLDDAARSGALAPGTLDQAFDDLEEWFTDSAPLIEEGILSVDVRMDPELGYPRWFEVAAADLDDESFAGPFTIIVTVDLVLPYTPIEVVAPYTTDDDREELEAALARWEAAGPTDYEFELVVHCECAASTAGPFVITVRSGEFASAVWQSGEGDGDPLLHSVADAFELISEAVYAGTDVHVGYDAALGHPLTAIIDTAAVSVDAGLAFTISGFRILEPLGFIGGQALAGPQCPVEKSPPDPGCEDRPVPGAVIHITRSPDDTVIPVTTSEDGVFLIALEPGVYTVTPQPVPGLLGTAAAVTVTVEPQRTTRVELAYDTGIR